MFKIKNKHTGEVIETPYLAEVEEYLNSGDCEMSDKKYPYIGRNELTGVDYIVYSDDCFYGFISEDFYTDINQEKLKNITREYLTKTYGKCESQYHADFICNLADNAGFHYSKDYNKKAEWFCFSSYRVKFYSEGAAKDNSEELINLPPPAKEKEMPKAKPVYTKEMHERGELPSVGSECLCYDYDLDGWFKVKVLDARKKSDEIAVVSISDNNKGSFVKLWWGCQFKPITTIEGELIDFVFQNSGITSRDGGRESAIYISNALLEKYNITPK